ncbi:hypothetical protein Dsin_000813 [Dipteronia sinensis]|uniref:Potassium transporter n=1 Tax=Dipteronia sinensis TaxID=43782 RepID=A0AAE0B346_9ROSI|nr:hypothetical protein Dsin_000813 [Dipteronia sinensis]
MEDTETQPQIVKFKDNDHEGTDQEKNLRDRKISATRLRHVDSLNLEAGRIGNSTGRPLNIFRLDDDVEFDDQEVRGGVRRHRNVPTLHILEHFFGRNRKQRGYTVMWISIVILILLFVVQRYGTDKVGASFAPIILLWFALNAGIGLYNLIAYDISTVLRAFYPKYIFDYFSRNGKQAWISLGGVVLCITGAEAMFADLGHFNVRSIIQASSQYNDPISFSGIVLPALLAAYGGQTAYLVKNPDQVGDTFYASIPVTGAFKNTSSIGNAYGIAVVAVMLITTSLVTLIMLVVWKTKIWWIIIFSVCFIGIELVYFSSVLYKFVQGGYLPLAFSLVLMITMGNWHYVHKKRYVYELNNKVSSQYMKDLVVNPRINRVPGIGLLYSELVQGIPPIFPHFISNIPSIHSVLVFVSIKAVPISKVALEERFLFRRMEPKDYRMFRCVVRYGYKDKIEEPNEFERQLVENLIEFIRQAENCMYGTGNNYGEASSSSSDTPLRGVEEEVEFIQKARNNGVVYLLGEAQVMAEHNSSVFKKFVVNYLYSFLSQNFSQREKYLTIPHERLLWVGMTYEI